MSISSYHFIFSVFFTVGKVVSIFIGMIIGKGRAGNRVGAVRKVGNIGIVDGVDIVEIVCIVGSIGSIGSNSSNK